MTHSNAVNHVRHRTKQGEAVMPFTGPSIAGQCPALVHPAVTGPAYRGACQFVGYNAFAGKAAGAGMAGAGFGSGAGLGGAGLGAKGLCLGLGLGLGAWGPLLVVGAAFAGGYLLFKKDSPSPAPRAD
jgi:hypothetical protein